ncbi:MAG: hypothetical protein CMC84_01020 [Flavobacteriaceae bacterium]|nr:hypothetical protein [Flavobacteriaceae bacterium]|tara:strand:+ start:3210 stop:3419 length:210 start_codon:yes stop_codon:yes gene_type:complete
MFHAFILVLVLGGIEQRGNPMYFKNINDCNYIASKLVFRYHNNETQIPKKYQVIAFCKPTLVNEKTRVY